MKTRVKKYPQGEMLPLETKQSGGKLLPHSDLRGVGGVSRGSITQQAKENGHFLGTWNVRSLYRAGLLTAAARELIEKNEMGGACGAYGGGKRCAQGSGGET